MRWLTYFPVIHNIHLTKDLGLLPFHMAAIPGNTAQLMGRFPDAEYPALSGEMKGLELVKLPEEGDFMFLDKAALSYLKKHAKEIDVLNLYHLSRHTIVYGLRYKKYNPKGKLYLKLDAYNSHLKEEKRYAKSWWKNRFFKILERRFLKAVDIVSIENKQGLDLAKLAFPTLENKLIYLPNGANDTYLKSKKYAVEKENIILSVGRMGGDDKNYDLLFRAIPFLELHDWQLKIIGPSSDEFKLKWEELRTQYPQKCASIEFVGSISDRDSIYEEYNKAKVFFLPSRFESFGIAYIEALYFGCILVGHSGMSAYGDISNNGEFGTFYADNVAESFANAIADAQLLSNEKVKQEGAKAHAAQNFYWSNIAAKLNQFIANV